MQFWLFYFAFFVTILFRVQPVSAANSVPVAKWFREYKKFMSFEMCRPRAFFPTCYKSKKEACLSSLNLALSQCLKKNRPGKLIKNSDEAIKLGLKVGECAGDQMHLRFLEQYDLKNPICYDRLKWH